MTTATRWTITDELGIIDLDSVTVDADGIYEALLPWFPDAPGDVLDALGDLEHALRCGEPTDSPAAFLGIRVSPATEDRCRCCGRTGPVLDEDDPT